MMARPTMTDHGDHTAFDRVTSRGKTGALRLFANRIEYEWHGMTGSRLEIYPLSSIVRATFSPKAVDLDMREWRFVSFSFKTKEDATAFSELIGELL